MVNMSFKSTKEIFQALIDGKKIKRKSWCNILFLMISEDGSLVDEKGTKTGYYFENPDEWEICEPPKKKIKFYKYQYRPKGHTWLETMEFYIDDHHFKKKFNPASDTIWKKKETDFIEDEE